MGAFAPVSGATLEVVSEFGRPGTEPMARLLYVPSASAFFGTTSAGGKHGHGTIFKLVGTTRTTLIDFTGESGAFKGSEPGSGLILGADGLLYGTTPKGGASDCGTMFKVSTAGAFTTILDFTGTAGNARGSAPGELLLQNGSYYGTTEGGGTNDLGTVFRYTPLLTILDSFTTLVEFTGDSGTKKGASPKGPLTYNSGSFFGVTEFGGDSDCGTVFKVTISGILIETITHTVLVHFDPETLKKGAFPTSGLVYHSTGNALYGTTEFGGADDCGIIFKVNLNGTNYSVLHEFADYDGATPKSPLVIASDDYMYGVTAHGGLDGYGILFKINALGDFFPLDSFTGPNGSFPGEAPEAGLIARPGGLLFGTTSSGGADKNGTVFQYTITRQHTVLSEFSSQLGWSPAGTPLFDGAGAIYMPMSEGGLHGAGTLLRVTGGVPSVVTPFSELLGEGPAGGLTVMGGEFFGATKEGGSSRGTIYRHTPGGSTVAISTLNTNSGSAPEGPVTVGADGFLYAVAQEGGALPRLGAILRISPAGARTTLVSFTGTTGDFPGEKPRAPLVFGTDGSLYGVTEKGGVHDVGTVFKISPQGVFSTLHHFQYHINDDTLPRSPIGGLAKGASSTLLGTTGLGGAGNKGTVFRITEAGVLTIIGEFTGSTGTLRGAHPAGALLVHPDGAIIGVTTESGANGFGTVFRMRLDGSKETLLDFTGTTGAVPGASPMGGVVLGPDDFLYGATEEGGTAGGGVIYRMKNLGPSAITDGLSFPGLITTIHGRAYTGGLPTTVSFDLVVTLPLLPPINLNLVPTQLTNVSNGVISYSSSVLGIQLGSLITYQARAVNAEGTATGILRTITELAPIQKWKAEFLGNSEVPDLDDHDLDGSLNLSEYGMVSDPASPSSLASPTPILKSYPEGTRLAMFLSRDPSRTDITIEVKAASSLNGPWTTVASSVNGAPFTGEGYVGGDANTPGIKTVEIRDVPPGAAASRVMKVVITH